MNRPPAALDAAPLLGNFVMLRADALRLMLPQADILSVEHRESRAGAAESDGLFSLPGSRERSLAALSEHMTLLSSFPDSRFTVTILAGEEIAWAWNEVQVLVDAQLIPTPLLPVLLGPDAPVDAYVEDEDGIAYLCTAQRLTAFALKRKG